MVSWILSKLFPYKIGSIRVREGHDGDSWSVKKVKENEKEYGGYNLSN